MLFSFVLPAYKASYFEEAISSILDQTYSNLELIIVNDASPEDLRAIIEKFNDSRIRYYVNESNIGGSDLVGQWNYALSYAKGDYVILASDDDIYHSDFLRTMVDLIQKYPQVNVLRPRVQRIDAQGKIIDVEGYLNEWISQIDFIYLWMVKGTIGSGIPFYVFKRSALLQNNGFVKFPLAWFSDDVTVLSLTEKGVVSTSKILFSFRQSGLNISSRRNDRRLLRLKLRAIDEFKEWFGIYISQICYLNPVERFELSAIKKSLDSFLNYHVQFVLKETNVRILICETNYILRNRYYRLWDLLLLEMSIFLEKLHTK